MGKPQLDTIVDRIVRQLRIGAHPSSFLRQVLGRRHGYTDREIDRALQKARRDGVIEYSKAPGTSRKMWRMVEHKSARNVGAAVAKAICNGDAHRQAKSELDVTHDQGFADGQMHAFQIVADRLRDYIAGGDLIGHGPARRQYEPTGEEIFELAKEIESGAWAEEEMEQ